MQNLSILRCIIIFRSICKVNNLSCYSKQVNTDNLESKSERGESEAVGNRAPNPQYTARISLHVMSPFFLEIYNYVQMINTFY